MQGRSDFLDKLLFQSQMFGCEYGYQLSNHLPMAIVALHGIGASKEDIVSFYDHHSRRLEKQIEDKTLFHSKNWRDHLGAHQFNSAYRTFFLSELKNNGMKTTLSTFLPELIPGVSGGAFHPLIRLAYGLEIDSEWEIAEALASWAIAYLELGKISMTTSGAPTELLSSLDGLASDFHQNPMSAMGDNVFHQLASVAESTLFKEYFSNLNLSQITQADLSAAAIRIYLSTKDSFNALHCVTSAHALRVLSPHLSGAQGLSYLWQGMSAAYLTIQCPPMRKSFAAPKDLPSWEEIFKVGRGHKNDHVIKLIYTAHEEFRYYGSELYQEVAAKKAGLLSW